MKKLSRSSDLMTSAGSASGLSNGKIKQGQQDETNIKVLRDLSHLPMNRHCFDCGQRGPTYVDITIGSFVCMTCSGLLRGLTPPHRIKSISMANFTSDEIETLKSRGNEYCRKVWLATSTAKDVHLGSENDPDRINTLKSLLSTKYEQKRFYIDPSRLPKGELSALHEQTMLALQQSNNTLQKSPSLSSTGSSSPSPIMNNLRSHSSSHHPPRLVNSITLPDIKPLTSLIGPMSSDLSNLNLSNGNGQHATNTTNRFNNSQSQQPAPINFINNLVSSTQNQSKFLNGYGNYNNNNNNNNNGSSNGHWETESEASSGPNEFVANFADFEDAFSSNSSTSNGSGGLQMNGGGGGHGSNLFYNNANPLPPVQKNMNGMPFNNNTTMQEPLMPHGGGNSNGFHFNIQNGPSPGIPNLPPPITESGDKYAALKDLDSIFKQNSSGDGVVNGSGTSALPNSTSLPANLSSSTNETGWFSTSPPNHNPNPFAQVPASTNGWSTLNTMNGNGAPRNGINQQNPFSNNSWQPNALSNGTNSVFQTSSSHSTPTTNFSSMMPVAVNLEMNGSGSIPSQFPTKAFNPFVSSPPRSNPNNPFL